MTVHYHGTPITPLSVLETLAGRHFCVSFAAPDQVRRAHQLGQSVMLDNGAFSTWKRGVQMDWTAFYDWALPWLDNGSTWLVLPDVVGGEWQETAQLISAAPWELRQTPHKAAPVWHLHDPIDRLLHLADWWPRICFGSSAEYSEVGSAPWHRRITQAFNALQQRHHWTQIHMLRGMQASRWGYPFASVDSTDIARNHHLPHNTAREMADRWDALQCPSRWTIQPEQESLWPTG